MNSTLSSRIGKPVNFLEFRFSKLNTPHFSHVKYALYWPVYIACFMAIEALRPLSECHVMYCRLDDMIPFCEYFAFPYLFWYPFLILPLFYYFIFEPSVFVRSMKFVMLTYTFAIVSFLVFPTCQMLRPEVLPRDNFFCDVMRFIYDVDTNTDVSPSVHVIGSFAALFAAFDSRIFSTKGWKTAFAVTAFVICLSTLFVKQHSVIDVIDAVPVCILGYYLFYRRRSPAPAGCRGGSSFPGAFGVRGVFSRDNFI